MGIIATARTAFRASLATFKLTTPNRAQLRRFVAATVDAGNEWLAKRDAQENSAPVDFAASRTAQFKTFTDALPEVALDADPEDPALAAAVQVK